MARPSFQFYPGDWRSNAKLRRCSPAARGSWIDILGVLHDSDEYGVIRWPLEDLASAAGVVLKHAKELVTKDVLRGHDFSPKPYIFSPFHAGKHGDPMTLVAVLEGQPCWYSSRLVRDEWVRQRRGLGTRFTAETQPPTRSPTRAVGRDIGERQGDGSSSSSSSSLSIVTAIAVTPSKPPRGDFEGFWLACPRKVGKGAARKAYAKAILKTSPDLLEAAVRRYAATRVGEPEAYTVHPATWLNAERWLDQAGMNGGAPVNIFTDDERREQQEALRRMGVIDV